MPPPRFTGFTQGSEDIAVIGAGIAAVAFTAMRVSWWLAMPLAVLWSYGWRLRVRARNRGNERRTL